MGLFSRKKKVSTPTASPASSTSSRMPSPSRPSTAVIEELRPFVPPMTLSVVLDGWTEGSGTQCFTVNIAKDADIAALRSALALQLGDVSMSLFKVNMPIQAAKQARAYTEMYKLPVNLVHSFACFNLDDPEQLVASLGPAGWQSTANKTDLRVKDWFPEPMSAETISLLVRRADGPSTSVPLSLAVHIALGGSSSRANRPTTPGGRSARSAAPVLDVLPTMTIAELKAAILKADFRSDDESERMVLWRVEMSQEEMVVIEERGGLKNGQMPWPYPPTAPVPTGLTDSSLPISHYFPTFRTNTRMITLSAFIPSSAPSLHYRSLPEAAQGAPVFRYPMTFISEPSSPASCSTTTATIRSPPLASPHLPTSPMLGQPPKRPSHNSRQRPSTAPAVVVSPNGSPIAGVPAFGSRRLGVVRPVNPSPLNLSTTAKGLGINTASAPTSITTAQASLAQHRGSTASHMSSLESEDEGSLPSLDFSLLSFDGEHGGRKGSQSALNTPVHEKSEWMQMSPAASAAPQLPVASKDTLAVPPTQKGLDRVMSVGRTSRWGRLGVAKA